MENRAYLSIPEAMKVVGRTVNLFAVVVEIGATRRSRGTDHFVTLKTVGPDCPPRGLSVTFFARDPSHLPRVSRSRDLVCLHSVLIHAHNHELYCTHRKGLSSFALFRGDADDLVPYQTSKNFRGFPQDVPFLKCMRCWALNTKQFEDPYLLKMFLIKEGESCDVVCRVLHVSGSSESGWTLFVWDAYEHPPLKFSSLEVEDFELFPTTLARDVLCTFPRFGSVLEVRPSTLFKEIPHLQEYRFWCRLCNVVWETHRGMWRGVLNPTSKIRFLSENDENVIDRQSFYTMRLKEGHVLFRRPTDSIPGPSDFTEIDCKINVEDTLIASITHAVVAHEFRCVVRVVAAHPWRYEDLWCSERGGFMVKLVLEDPTARIHVFLDGEDGLKFFNGYPPHNDLKISWNKLLGFQDYGNPLSRSPPWVLCGLKSYYVDENDQLGSRRYRIFGTKLVK